MHRTSLYLLMIAGLFLSAHRVYAGTLTLIQDRQAHAVIVKNSASGRAASLAAEELQKHLTAMTGVTLEILNHQQWDRSNQSRIAIVFGHGTLTEQLPIKTDLPAEGFQIVVAPEQRMVALLGQEVGDPLSRALPANRESDFGPLYAAYDLLEQLGVRWFYPGDLGTVIPDRQTIVIDHSFEKIDSPDFAMRNFWLTPQVPTDWPPRDDWTQQHHDTFEQARQEMHLWSLRNRAGNHLAYHARHHHPNWWTLWHESHPQYLGLYQGSRGWQAYPERSKLCMSNPQVVQAVANLAREAFDRSPTRKSYSIAEQDGGSGFCSCQDCLALDQQAPNATPGSYTHRYVHFWNAVAREVSQTHPERYLGVYLYSRYIEPADTPLDLHPNLHPVLVNNYLVNTQRFEHLVGQWSSRTPTPVTFYLLPLYGSYGMNLLSYPWVSLDSLAKGMRYFKQQRVAGYRATAYAVNNNWIPAGPMHYLVGRLSWDTQQDPHQIVEEYCQQLFGPAAQPMLAYFYALESWQADAPSHAADTLDQAGEEFPHQRVADAAAFYTPERLQVLRSHLQDALSRADQQVVRDRLHLFVQNLRYTELDLAATKALEIYEQQRTSQAWEHLRTLVVQRDELLSQIPDFAGILNPADLRHQRIERAYEVQPDDRLQVFRDTFANQKLGNWRRRVGFDAIVPFDDVTGGHVLRARSESEAIVIDRPADVVPGQSYDARIRWRGPRGDRLRLRFVASSKTLANAVFAVQSDDWQTSEYRLTVPADCESVRIYVIMTPDRNRAADTVSEIMIDQIEFRQADDK